MRYLFDTNILIIFLRNNQVSTLIRDLYNPLEMGNIPIVSIVSVGELESFSIRNNWGIARKKQLDTFLQQFVITDINADDVIEAYGKIDAYSQGKLLNNPLPVSARNMGKNDLWIAATAFVTNATLLTTDNDFDHLNSSFFKVEKIIL